jgi:hypothetical protein
MNTSRIFKHPLFFIGSALVAAIFTVSSHSVLAAAEDKANLEGSQEVPPVESAGSGAVDISVADDGTVTGNIELTGIEGTMAHIHNGARGSNGPPIITLIKDGTDFTVPENTKLTAEQIELYKNGDLYVNVHSTANPAGELRAQLEP